MNTKEAIVSQLCENTGIHFLDSGGAYGRHHERNASKAWDELAKADQFGVTQEFYCYTEPGTGRGMLRAEGTLHTAWYMYENLTYCEDLDQQWREFAEEFDGGVWSLENVEEFVTSLGKEYHTVNTYNGESDLSQVLQFVEFGCPEGFSGRYVLLATHNGCDVRGGYSQYRVYELDDGCWSRPTARCLVAHPYIWVDDMTEDPRVQDIPCFEFVYESKLEQSLKDLVDTNKNDAETQGKMREQDAVNRQLAFDEFCEQTSKDLDGEDFFVVSEGKGWFYDGDCGPEQLVLSQF